MSDHIQEINDNNFAQDVLKSESAVLVDFWAPWCGPCKALGPMVESLAQAYQGKMSFAKFDIDQSPETPARYGIKAIPTIAIFKDGEPVEMMTGLTSHNQIEKSIKKSA
jgi:thioredoxin 1